MQTTLGARIRQARERRSYGQAELAREVGIQKVTLYRIEYDKHVPRPATVRKLALALGVDVLDLLG